MTQPFYNMGQFSDMRKTMSMLQPLPKGSLMVHPATFDWLKRLLGGGSGDNLANGILVTVSDACPEFVRRWVFPKDRFVEYGPKDEYWAIPLGFGRWEQTKDRWMMFMEDRRSVMFTNVS